MAGQWWGLRGPKLGIQIRKKLGPVGPRPADLGGEIGPKSAFGSPDSSVLSRTWHVMALDHSELQRGQTTVGQQPAGLSKNGKCFFPKNDMAFLDGK